MAQNMYRVGDYVYFEVSSAAPFQVRRIEELNKTSTGNVEAKVMCFYRRRDISPALLNIADKLPSDTTEEKPVSTTTENGTSETNNEERTMEDGREESESPKPMQVDERGEAEENEKEEKTNEKKENECNGNAGLPTGAEALDSANKHLLRQRELFLSRQIETLPATHIRGKCVVTLLNEVETPDSYLGRDDAFFYSLVYDPSAKTLLADKGEIRVGDKYQAEICDLLSEEDRETYITELKSPETLVFRPNHELNDREIDQLLIVARAVGTFSRALDTSSSVKLPNLQITAAAASRDVTLFHAMTLLHQADYDLGNAMKFLVPPSSKQHYPLEADKTTNHNTVSLGGPVLCRDQMEEWSAAEANLFEEAIEKYGKDFNDIRHDFLPWKALNDIVEYYYMWKTTDRYVQSKRVKAQEAESRLKQVYIPNYNKPNPNSVGPPNPTGQPVRSPTTPCESCKTETSAQWYAWGPAHLQMRLCSDCWTFWKKNGGLRCPHEYENCDKNGTTPSKAPLDFVQNATGIARGATLSSQQRGQQKGYSGSLAGIRLGGSQAPKTRVAFFLHTTLMTRVARRLAPKTLLNIRKSARRPFIPINTQAIKQHCQSQDPKEIIQMTRQLRGGRIPDAMMEALNASNQIGGIYSSPVSTAPASGVKRSLSNGLGGHPPAKHSKMSAPLPAISSAEQTEQLKSQGPMYAKWLKTTEDVYYLANRGVKQLRRSLISKVTRSVGRSPCKSNEFVSPLLARLTPPPSEPSSNGNSADPVEST